MINWKTNQGHEISQILQKLQTKFWSSYLGKAPENLKFLELWNCCWNLLEKYEKSTFCWHSCIIEIIHEYLQNGWVFIKLEISNLKNEFFCRYFSRIFLKINWNEIRLYLLLTSNSASILVLFCISSLMAFIMVNFKK